MKINKAVIDKYMQICSYSTHKCNSFSEIEYKINRAVFLGKVLRTYPYREIQYGNLKFTVDTNTYTIIDLERNEVDTYEVPQYRKLAYERRYYNIVV
ncbi:hypothetical protein SAMN04487895_101503 [Paenibacillus sophorae]|uniref:Uncharacterized protein n=1 Tax=Paenibacillus sophorae TaxID=1333845 RepID=A0A1H8GG37_9BACL|nr:hypothetical protein [Paenibacillus sophorae]QWU14213.1 hypothetical protein KP014_20080 [Paenibacillus sophorae]SEN42972.1 hypothetical protein SAMN04487895_101503 [Paenibacillus sophorae]